MEITELKIRNFDPLDFFQKIAIPPTTFMRTEEWIIIAWEPHKTEQFASKSPFHSLRKIQTKKNKSNIPFQGGVIGAFSYDLGHKIYDLKPRRQKLPLAVLHHYENYLCYNLKTKKIHAPKKLVQTIKKIAVRELPYQQTTKFKLKPQTTRTNYNQAYKKIKKYILDGDIYEVNLTHQLTAKYTEDPKALFAEAYRNNPAEFATYFETKDFQIISLSPERFIKLKNGTLTTTPIKGTLPIDKDPDELLQSPKEAAELNMITDLLRNDLGQISEPGSVKVTKNRALMKAGAVWHTYSEIRSSLARNKTAADVMEACFPGGSITGCPKKRSMEIIAELEPHPRGFYTGSIGYFSYNGNMDTNILIRTLVLHKQKLSLGVGGAIVMDSTQQSEYEETLYKARAFTSLNEKKVNKTAKKRHS